MNDYLNMRLQPADQRAISYLQQVTGIHSISETIRLALHECARGKGLCAETHADTKDDVEVAS